MPRRIGPGGPWIVASQPASSDVSQPPFSRAWLPTVLAAWSLAPILLWSNGFQIPQADNPPPKPSVQSLASWEPEAAVVQGRRFIPQGAVADATQPYASTLNELVAAWTPEVPQQQPRRLLVQGAQVDSPIPGYKPWLRTALDSWAQSPVILWQNGFTAQDGPAQVPFSRAWAGIVDQSWAPVSYTPQVGPRLAQGAAAAVAAQPYETWINELIAAWWQAPDELPFQRRLYQAQGTPAQVDSPVPGYRPWLKTAIDSWTQSPLLLWQNGFIAQDGPAPPGDAPPIYKRRELLAGAVDAWETRLVPLWSIAGAQTQDLPPFGERAWLSTVLRSWEPDTPVSWAPTWPAWQRSRFVVQGTPAVVNNPPFGLRPWFNTVRDSWEPAVQPILNNFSFKATFVVQEGPAVTEVQDWLIQARRRERR